MRFCTSCGTDNAVDNKFCQQCGQPFTNSGVDNPPATANETVLWSGKLPQLPKEDLRRSIPVDQLFATKSRIIIGRAGDCDVCLPHPTVSRYHAVLEKLPEGLRLRDLSSVNGVLVAGKIVNDSVLIHEGERVGIGPFLFSLKGGSIFALDNSRSLRLEARGLEKIVPTLEGKPRKLLDNINLVVEPGEFVSLLGPSGSGKSTLMDCLNGRRRATSGKVLANGEDFYQHFDSFRQSLGYVPQKDIVHNQLTVYRALYYTAQLRLPRDTEPAEFETRIEDVVREMELQPHRNTLVANLSGGQIKRVSLGAELLARPCLLYIDEATSGLDAGTEARMMRLFRRLADEGKSIICITHNVDNVDRCHLALVLVRGRLIYYAPPQEALAYFGVSRISEVYDRLADKDLEAWEREFASSSLYKEFVEKRLAEATPPVGSAGPVLNPVSSPFHTVPKMTGSGLFAGLLSKTAAAGEQLSKHKLRVHYTRLRDWFDPLVEQVHQFRVLTRRYAELVWSDKRSLRMLILQAPIVGLFLLVGFVHKPYEARLPLVRKPDDSERRMLTAIQGFDKLLEDPAKITPEQREALSKVEFALGDEKNPAHINGLQLSEAIHRTHAKPLDSLEKKALEELKVALPGGATITGAEIAEEIAKLHRSNPVNSLLESEFPTWPTGDTWIDPRFTFMLLNILAITTLWFGCNNAAKEIVKEEAIYGRERAVNLSIVPYIGSKFLVLSLVSVVQVFFLMFVVFGVLELLHLVAGHQRPPPEYHLSYVGQFGVLFLLSLVGVALGLVLSACVSSPDRANALLPYVLIPQIILGGAIISIKGGVMLFLACTLSPVYWAYQGIHRGSEQLPEYHPMHQPFPSSVGLACLALFIQLVVLLLATGWFLRGKDAR